MKNLATKPITECEKIDWIRLARTENIGPATFFRLLEIFNSASSAIEKIPDFSLQAGIKKSIKVCHKSIVEHELEKTRKYGAEILIFLEDDYPRLLREINDPPPVLTIFGNKNFLNDSSIAIVGPRNASFHACQFAKKMALDLANDSIIVVSGLAKGVDTAAHIGAIDGGTIAVLAGGINHIYPSENSDLYKQISKKGTIISEMPFDMAPRGSNFIQRNRIIAGMSLGVVVVEAGLQSGSLATARFALDQGREIFAVPGFPADPRNFGSNLLLEEGAIFTQNANRIIREFPSLVARFSEAGKLHEPEGKEFIYQELKMPLDDDIKKVREEILKRIGFMPIAIDDILHEMKLSARVLNIALVQLELADKITINNANIIKREG